MSWIGWEKLRVPKKRFLRNVYQGDRNTYAKWKIDKHLRGSECVVCYALEKFKCYGLEYYTILLSVCHLAREIDE